MRSYVQRQTTSPGRLAAMTLVVLGVVLFLPAASAEAGVGWAFKERLGSAAEPSFSRAAGMATDSSGDLYVIDVGVGLRRFNPDGTPANFSALGTNLIDGAGIGDQTPGNATAQGFFDSVAIDRSGGATDGNIYVGNNASDTVDIFSSEGEFLGQLTESSKGPLGGTSHPSIVVSVSEAGDVFVFDNGDIGDAPDGDWVHRYEPIGSTPTNADNVATLAVAKSDATPSMVVGIGPSDGYFFLGRGDVLRKFDSQSGTELYGFGSGILRTVDPVTGHIFAASGKKAFEWEASGPEAPEDFVAELQDAGSVISGLAVADGAETLYLADNSGVKVDVYQKVQIPEATVGPPLAVSGAKAIASGIVNPAGVEVGECYFEYGKTTSYGSMAPCKETLPVDSSDHQVTAQLSSMLANGNTYHYRLVVKGAQVGQDASGDEAFLTGETFTADPATAVTQTGALLRGTVRAEGLELTDCRFEWGETADYGQSVPCDPHFSSIPNDDADHGVKGTIGGLEPSTLYHYRLVAENALGQIVSADRTLFTGGKPRIVEQTPIEVRQTTAVMQARINPSGAPTSYHFEWGPDASYGNRIPVDHELIAGSGSEPVTVQASLSGLRVAADYHFRVVATNASGTSAGSDQTFETLGENGLPEKRAYELVTPADKGAAGAIADSFSGQQFSQASVDGESFMYPLLNGLDASTAGGWVRQLAVRSDEGSGWLSTQLSSPALISPSGTPEFEVLAPSNIKYLSPDNSCAFLETYNPLTEDTPKAAIDLGVTNLYRWSADSGDYELISNRLPQNPELDPVGGGYYRTIEASDDCSRVYFSSPYEFISGASGLYEWNEGTMQDTGEDTTGSAVLGGAADVAATSRWNAVSPDGSRVFFTATTSEGAPGTPGIFLREDETVTEISTSETAVPTSGARFEAASPDGTRVFFRANYGIDAQNPGAGTTKNGACGPRSETETDVRTDPELEPKSCDLYAYDVETGELTDLSAHTSPQGAQIQGVVAIDEDGSHVYFATLGQLVPGKGRTYAQNTAGFGSANVYLYRNGEPLTYVTTLAEHGPSPSEVGLVGDLLTASALMRRALAWTAATSADGSELVFESSRNLTGYETGRVDKFAAYLYSADSGRLVCVSCRPDGLPLAADVVPGGTEGHQSSWLLAKPQSAGYRARSISADGRLVAFSTPDAIAPGAVAGKRNVYLWRGGQVTLLAIAERGGVNGAAGYQGMSADGNDIFIASGQQLAPQDKDFISDVYDVRVGGGFPFSEPPPECQVNESIPLQPNQIYCQGDRTSQPGTPSPSSAGFRGPGNLPEGKSRPRRCPKGKVRRRGKCVKRPKRGAKQKKRNRAANTNRGGAK
jgi:hypothetical protein